MAGIAENGSGQGFARAFGDQLKAFLESKEVEFAEAAVMLGLDRKKGKSRLNSYFHDKETFNKKQKKKLMVRSEAGAEILYRVCARFGFEFEYEGYRIRAEKLDGTAVPTVEPQQLQFVFNRKFKLIEDKGDIRVNVTRPPGRIELSVSLKADAS